MIIKGGKQYGSSKLTVDAIAPEGSKSEMDFGDQFEQSKRTIRFTELPSSVDLAQLANQLDVLTNKMRESGRPQEEIGAIDAAKNAAHEGDRHKTAGYLANAGHWALDTATKIGIPLAVEALTHLLTPQS